MLQKVLKGDPQVHAQAEEKPVRPTMPAALTSAVLLVVGVLFALADLAEEFKPRVEVLDALAGLTIGAFVVERLLTFAPPILAHGARGNEKTEALQKQRIKQRAADIAFLRVGYGALLGGLFVMATDLRAVKVLSPE